MLPQTIFSTIVFAAIAYGLPQAAPACTSYTVMEGDNCFAIGLKSGVTAEDIIAANENINPDCTNLFVGEMICIPAASGVPNGSPTPTPTPPTPPAGGTGTGTQPPPTDTPVAPPPATPTPDATPEAGTEA